MLKTVKLSDLTTGREIASGGEGTVYEHPSNKDHVVKVYHKVRNKNFVHHLEKLWSLSNSFVKPIEIYCDNRFQVLGFSMLYVDFNSYWLFNNLFNKGFCTSNSITMDFKIKVFENLAVELTKLHAQHIVIGDLNQYNIFFNKNAEILFVDVDSYQTADSPHSGVLLDEIRDWTTQEISDKSDIWAYDILAFWATTYCHPFKWVMPGNKESLEERVKGSKSILSKLVGVKIPALYQPPQDKVRDQFIEIFNGRRYPVNLIGYHTPVNIVVKQALISQSLVSRELYDNVYKIYDAGTHIAVNLGNKDWRLMETFMAKATRELLQIFCDDLYPSNSSNYAYTIGEKLHPYAANGKNMPIVFKKPVFSFNNGSLAVVDYGADIQWNYDIQHQLAGIDSTNTPVFAKSITNRSSLIQNFGNKRYLNIPVKNSYSLVSVTSGIQDAIYVRGYVAVESRKNNRTDYEIYSADNPLQVQSFDYLPHFTCIMNNNIILVPNDGSIDIYQYTKNTGFQAGSRFDCPLCTRDSKLYHTASGILMLENNILYLLNTK